MSNKNTTEAKCDSVESESESQNSITENKIKTSGDHDSDHDHLKIDAEIKKILTEFKDEKISLDTIISSLKKICSSSSSSISETEKRKIPEGFTYLIGAVRQCLKLTKEEKYFPSQMNFYNEISNNGKSGFADKVVFKIVDDAECNKMWKSVLKSFKDITGKNKSGVGSKLVPSYFTNKYGIFLATLIVLFGDNSKYELIINFGQDQSEGEEVSITIADELSQYLDDGGVFKAQIKDLSKFNVNILASLLDENKWFETVTVEETKSDGESKSNSKSKSKSKSKSTDTRPPCSAMTKDKHPCTRKSTDEFSGKSYCKQHLKKIIHS